MVDGSYYESGNYYFYITDHLGNNRIVTDAAAAVVQSTQYYPFGTAFAEGTTAEQGKQPYKYNGKELDQMHGLNLYDYSARYYESAIGRFTTVDPLAEKYYSISPYAYCANNPLKFVDPTGMSYTYNWDKGVYQDENGKEVEWGTVKESITEEQKTNDIIINGANNSSVTVKTSLVNKSFNSSIDFKGNHKIDASNVAIGYERTVELRGAVGAGLYAKGSQQKVLFLGGNYSRYWYTFSTIEPGLLAQTAGVFSIGGGKNWFIAFNNKSEKNNPFGFTGGYITVGGSVGVKCIAGLSVNGGLTASIDNSWNIISLGTSFSMGASIGLFGGGSFGLSTGIGYTFLMNTNVIRTEDRSFIDQSFNLLGGLGILK